MSSYEKPTRWKTFASVVTNGIHIVAACFYLSAVLMVGYPLDRQMIKSLQAEQVQSVLRDRIQSSDIVAISAFSPIPKSLVPDTAREAVRTAIRSIRQMTGTAPKPDPPRERMDYWQVFVKVRPDVTEPQAVEFAGRVHEVLAQTDTGDYWHTHGYCENNGVSVHRYYPRRKHAGALEADSEPSRLDSEGEKQ